jgi:hypothetical protein
MKAFIFALLAFITFAIMGVVTEVHGERFSNFPPFTWLATLPDSLFVYGSYSFLLIGFAIYYFEFRSQQKQKQEAKAAQRDEELALTSGLEKLSARLEHSLGALPPRNFADNVRNVEEYHIKWLMLAKNGLHDNELSQIIRSLIVSVTGLCQRYSMQNGVTYESNLCLFYPINSISDELLKSLKPFILFEPRGLDRDQLLGVLVSEPYFSVNEEGLSAQSRIVAFAVYKDRNANLPGCAECFFDHQLKYFNSISNLIKNCRTKLKSSSICEAQIEEIGTYFKKDVVGKNIQSFISLPVAKVTSKEHDFYNIPSAILNIHATKSSILQEGAGADYFEFSISTLLTYLAYYLDLKQFDTESHLNNLLKSDITKVTESKEVVKHV